MTLKFKPIGLPDQASYQAHLVRCPLATSDYSFLNLWAFAPAYGLEWAWADDLVCLRQSRPSTVFWAPVGDWQTADWPGFFKKFPLLKSALIRVPGPLARLWASIFGERVVISEDRNQFDYLYKAEDLILLKGNQYHKKKNLIRQFEKLYDYEYVPMTPDMVKQAKTLQEDWCMWRDCDSDDQLAAENQAIARTFAEWEHLSGVLGGCLLVDGRVAAYTIGERMSPDTMIVHFEKGGAAYKGVYQTINRLFLAHEANGIEWVNREQDLGDEGLRKSKESYHPARFLKKYRVEFLS
ncbi:MAG: phosphatidylglycerol lysyltransferase domain-containing protein [Desulfosalsimonadaceae bacterium]